MQQIFKKRTWLPDFEYLNVMSVSYLSAKTKISFPPFGFRLGIFSRGIYCYANFSIVLFYQIPVEESQNM